MSESLVEVTFALDDPSLDDHERQEFTKKLLKQLREQGDAESLERTDDLGSEVGSKGGIDKLVGALTAEVKFDKVISFFGFVGEKFAEKPIEVHVKIGDREVTIKGTGEKAIAQAKQAAIDIQSALRGDVANG
ncbi:MULTISPECIES: hypothetical protein [Pseudanabaena]|uniref:hypothetical protein n=1 Tax=Pseudanabaena TaxID=1152 RepID=UPI0024786889|nr:MULTISPECIES: hypothetical protein [Pseudanabaena]MEA5487508.1 hypothetical protein [Pseudanabaena sp. CCNP1317]WGS74016.1 hypothetical protein OA858_08310 [Pseudanabaena galeata CCNP1313]